MNVDVQATSSQDVFDQATRFEPGYVCPIDILENEGGPVLDRDIIEGYGCDANLSHTDTLMSHEGLGLSVGYAMTGEDYPD